MTFDFADQQIDMHAATRSAIAAIRWRHLSYRCARLDMSVLNPVRRVRHAFIDFAYRHIARPMPEFLAIVRRHSGEAALGGRCARGVSGTNSPVGCASG